jgi:hypothetical protein
MMHVACREKKNREIAGGQIDGHLDGQMGMSAAHVGLTSASVVAVAVELS